jgi:hypothetical protein
MWLERRSYYSIDTILQCPVLSTVLRHAGSGSSRSRTLLFVTCRPLLCVYSTVRYGTCKTHICQIKVGCTVLYCTVDRVVGNAKLFVLYCMYSTLQISPRTVAQGTGIVSWERGGSVRPTLLLCQSRPGFTITPHSQTLSRSGAVEKEIGPQPQRPVTPRRNNHIRCGCRSRSRDKR